MYEVELEDLIFLIKLDRKLHYIQETYSEVYGHCSFDSYTDKSMTEKDIKNIFEIIEKNNLTFYPINTNMGLSVGFKAVSTKTKIQLLTFREAQLPKKYDFKRLSKCFMDPENIKKAKSLGIEIINDRSHYDY